MKPPLGSTALQQLKCEVCGEQAAYQLGYGNTLPNSWAGKHLGAPLCGHCLQLAELGGLDTSGEKLCVWRSLRQLIEENPHA